MKLLGELFAELKAVTEDGEPLLDRTMVLYGSQPRQREHARDDEPAVALRRRRLQARPAPGVRHASATTRCRTCSSRMLQRMGLEADKFASSHRHDARAGTGRLTHPRATSGATPMRYAVVIACLAGVVRPPPGRAAVRRPRAPTRTANSKAGSPTARREPQRPGRLGRLARRPGDRRGVRGQGPARPLRLQLHPPEDGPGVGEDARRQRAGCGRAVRVRQGQFSTTAGRTSRAPWPASRRRSTILWGLGTPANVGAMKSRKL